MTPGINKVFVAMLAVIVILVAAIAIIIKRLDVQKDDNKAFQQAMSAKFDTIRNKMGQQTATVPASVFSDIKTLKSAVGQLNANGANIQSKIDGNTRALVLLAKNIGATIKGTTTIASYDTVKSQTKAGIKDTLIFPNYAIDTVNKFFSLKGLVGNKHFEITPVFYDSTEVKGEVVSHGIFKKGELTAFALSKNPYATTTQFKALTVQKTPAPIWKIVLIILGASGGFYLGTHFHN